MTTQPKYKTTATGSINYAQYDQRAREIRSQDAWIGLAAVGNAMKAVAKLFGRDKLTKVSPISKVALRKPMRTPRLRRARPRASQAECQQAIR